VPIEYEGETFAEGFRADLIVESKVLLELKSVERVTPAHKKQLLTYLRLTGLKLGYLLNFGEALMRDGITRTINGSLDPIPLSPCDSMRGKDSTEELSLRRREPGGAETVKRLKRQRSTELPADYAQQVLMPAFSNPTTPLCPRVSVRVKGSRGLGL
jgi:hypothetical protein